MNICGRIPSVIWGTCWFNESVDTIVSFVNDTQRILLNMDIRFSFIVFDAKFNRNPSYREYLKKQITGHIIVCEENRYPNKNLGVSIITEIAHISEADIVAVVDSDWKISNFERFVLGLLFPVITGTNDVVFPDIVSFAGRDNYLVGIPILRLFFPKLNNKIKTPFPGAFAGVTEKIHKITSSSDYHYDWGGEWDLVSGSEKYGLRVAAPALGMRNIRHRSSYSKTSDAYQIWRACFQGIDVEKLNRIADECHTFNIDTYTETLFPYIQLKGCASAQSEIFISLSKTISISATIRQLLNMVLMPLSLILDGDDISAICTIPDGDVSSPYDRKELNIASEIVEYSVIEALKYSKLPLAIVSDHAKALSGGFMGDWSLMDYNHVRDTLMCQVKGVDIKWT